MKCFSNFHKSSLFHISSFFMKYFYFFLLCSMFLDINLYFHQYFIEFFPVFCVFLYKFCYYLFSHEFCVFFFKKNINKNFSFFFITLKEGSHWHHFLCTFFIFCLVICSLLFSGYFFYWYKNDDTTRWCFTLRWLLKWSISQVFLCLGNFS